MARPMQTHTKGKLCTKLVVPSTGSHIHVGSDVSSSVKPCDAHTHAWDPGATLKTVWVQ